MFPFGMPDEFYREYINDYIESERIKRKREKAWNTFWDVIKWAFTISGLIVICVVAFWFILVLIGGAL